MTVHTIYQRFIGTYKPGNKERYIISQKLNTHKNNLGIISVSLFGNLQDKQLADKYLQPLLRDGPKLHKDLPGFYIRVYLDPRATKEVIDSLLQNDFEVFIMEKPSEDRKGHFWRFLALGDPGNKYTFLSDTDGILNYENSFLYPKITIKVLSDWEKSGEKFLLRGQHRIYMPFSTNRFCMKDYKIENIEQLMEGYDGSPYGDDEVFLKKEIYPIIQREGYKRIFSWEGIYTGILLIIFLIPLIIVIINTRRNL